MLSLEVLSLEVPSLEVLSLEMLTLEVLSLDVLISVHKCDLTVVYVVMEHLVLLPTDVLEFSCAHR